MTNNTVFMKPSLHRERLGRKIVVMSRFHCPSAGTAALMILAVMGSTRAQPVTSTTREAVVTNDPVVTSDTPEYCDSLMKRIGLMTQQAVQPPPVQVTTLSEEGERLCGSGQVRDGVASLRRAIVLMRKADNYTSGR
jgi:hypothetical protein